MMNGMAAVGGGNSSRHLCRSIIAQGAARERSLASAVLHRMLALAFSNPEPGLLRSIIRECGGLKIALARGVLPAHFARCLKDVDREWRAVTIERHTAEYSRLFLGGGLVPLREGGFGDGMRFAGQPVDIADVSGFYLAFGFVLPDSAANPPDHLGAELEFMSLLHLKLALALQRGRMEHARVTRSAIAAFLQDHLGRWADPFVAALADKDAAPAYRTMGRLLAWTVEADCASFAVKPSKARVGSARDPIGERLVCPFGSHTDTISGAGPLRRGSC